LADDTRPSDDDATPASPEAEAEAPSPSDEPKKKKKKKKPESAETLDDPRAAEISVAFDAGDFVRVRALGQKLLDSGDPELVAVGRDYLARIAVDPIQIAFLGLCAVALLTIAWIYIPH
jgi:hypothetical protein